MLIPQPSVKKMHGRTIGFFSMLSRLSNLKLWKANQTHICILVYKKKILISQFQNRVWGCEYKGTNFFFQWSQDRKFCNIMKLEKGFKWVMTYHGREQIRLDKGNPLTDFVKMAANVLNILIVLLAFFPVLLFHWIYLANVVDIPD